MPTTGGGLPSTACAAGRLRPSDGRAGGLHHETTASHFLVLPMRDRFWLSGRLVSWSIPRLAHPEAGGPRSSGAVVLCLQLAPVLFTAPVLHMCGHSVSGLGWAKAGTLARAPEKVQNPECTFSACSGKTKNRKIISSTAGLREPALCGKIAHALTRRTPILRSVDGD